MSYICFHVSEKIFFGTVDGDVYYSLKNDTSTELGRKNYSSFELKEVTTYNNQLIIRTPSEIIITHEMENELPEIKLKVFYQEKIEYISNGIKRVCRTPVVINDMIIFKDKLIVSTNTKIHQIDIYNGNDQIILEMPFDFNLLEIYDNTIAITSGDKVIFFSLSTDEVSVLELFEDIIAVRYNSERGVLLLASPKKVYVVSDQKLINTFSIPTNCLSFYENYFITCIKNKIKFWNLRNFEYVISLEIFDEDIVGIFSEKKLYIGNGQDIVALDPSIYFDDSTRPRSPGRYLRVGATKSPLRIRSSSPHILMLLERYEKMQRKGVKTHLESHLPSEAEIEIWEFLNENKPEIEPVLEFSLDMSFGGKHSYDFLLSHQKYPDIKIILEYDGLQHFFKPFQVGKDIKYMCEALEKGYSFIRLQGLFQDPHWKDKLSLALDKVYSETIPQIVMIGDRYEEHIKNLDVCISNLPHNISVIN